MTSPRVSVIIPTYQHAHFILATLESVLAQRYSDYEVIVVNDGSTDDTRAILEPLIAAGRIRYFEQSNGGVAQARNAGLAQAKGELIALLDDDDLWPDDKLEWQVGYLDENPSVAAVGGTLQIIDPSGTAGWKGRAWSSIGFETLFSGNPFYSPGQTLIRKAVLMDIGGLNNQLWGADDWDLWFRIARVSRLGMLDRVSLYYRQHPDNASKQSARMLRASCTVLEKHLRGVDRSRRRFLRLAAYRNVYDAFGSRLARGASGKALRGDFSAAMKYLRDLSPLRRGVLTDPRLAARFLRDLLMGG